MRGPGMRLNYDVRRLWRCPRCGYERHAPATEAVVHCHCNENRPWMKLVEPIRTVRPPPPPFDPYIQLEDVDEPVSPDPEKVEDEERGPGDEDSRL